MLAKSWNRAAIGGSGWATHCRAYTDWSGLAICLLLLALPACQMSFEKDEPVVRDNSGTADAAQRAEPKQEEEQHAVTQAEIDELWAALSDSDRALLEENFQGKSSWDKYVIPPNAGSNWDALSDEEREEFIENGIDREQYIEQQERMALMIDMEHVRRRMESELRRLRPMNLASMGAVRGTALAWRELFSLPDVVRKHQMSTASMFVGNFDDDPEEEVALYSQGLSFVEQDGTAWQQPDLVNTFLRGAWDYDGDGRDELRAAQPAEVGMSGIASSDSRFLDMGGRLLGQLQGSASPSASRWTDLDGDGTADFVTYQSSADNLEHGLQVYGRGGTLLFATDAMGWNFGLSGDVDGDGMDELLIRLPADHEHQYEPRFVGLQQEAQEAVEACGHMVREEILALLDLNGDGREDIVCDGVVYLSWNSELVKLEMPTQYHLPAWNGRSSPHLHIWQRGTQRLLAGLLVQEDEAGARSDTLAMWNGTGELVYLEHFGAELLQLAVGRDGRRLYVLTREKLLVSD
jgi:hypothetical protein